MKCINHKNYIFTFIMVLLICGYCFNTKGSILKLGRRESIKSIGLSLSMFDGFESRPINFPDLFTSKNSNIKFYKTADIWHYKQYIGSWGNNNAMLTLAEMSFPASASSKKYITEKQTVEKFKTKSNSAYWDKNKKLKWLELFTNQKIKEKPRFLKRKDGTILEFYPLNKEISTYGLFIVSNKAWLKKCFLFLYTVKPVVSKKRAMKLILSSIKSIRLSHSSEKAKLKKRSGTTSEYETSKEQVLRNIRNLKDWWGLDTKDYFIITNYPKKLKPFIKETEAELLQSQKIYSLFYKKIAPSKEVNVVRIFKDRDDYAAYVGKNNKWTMGLWMPSKKELVISPLEQAAKRKNETSQIKILRHEAFHQYIHYALDKIPTSAWFNEGNAAFFENLKIIGKRLKVEPSDRYLRLLKKMIKKQNPDINALLNMSYKQFYNGSKETVAKNYALAWGIVYFIYKGAPNIRRRTGRDYTKILKNYYKQLIRKKNPEKAAKAAWSNINIKQFTSDFVKYYKKQ